ncbi:single-stranded DNA-binding protein [Salinicola peritrichatus]|uniref:single-stranded DNA-binding protein n=1 Tax=Salinicola peritrichatus TaxID=1267424 RepID=UPI0013A6496F|nr:single-stranded DNA-binding protein [Salinicola peritrichatus]
MGVYTAVGRVGRQAEVRQTQGGHAVAGFPVAVDVGFGQNKSTLWLDCSIWGKRAEGGLIQYLVKGQEVFVSGEIGTREFQKKDGSPGFAVTLKVSEINLVGGQGGQQQSSQQPNYGGYQQAKSNYAQQQNQPPQGGQQNYGAPAPGSFDDFNDEIPF